MLIESFQLAKSYDLVVCDGLLNSHLVLLCGNFDHHLAAHLFHPVANLGLGALLLLTMKESVQIDRILVHTFRLLPILIEHFSVLNHAIAGSLC